MNNLAATRLKAAREKMGLTQNQVASVLGINREQISYIETGKRQISLSLLNKLANIYGCSLDFFMGEESKEPDLVMAFRASDILDEDLESIVWVQRFAHNLNELHGWLDKER